MLANSTTGIRCAVPDKATLIIDDFGHHELVIETILRHDIKEFVDFVAKIVVPESVSDPLGYYLNNTSHGAQPTGCAVIRGIKHFIFSSTAAVYGEPEQNPAREDERLTPISTYGRSKLMSERILEYTARATSPAPIAMTAPASRRPMPHI